MHSKPRMTVASPRNKTLTHSRKSVLSPRSIVCRASPVQCVASMYKLYRNAKKTLSQQESTQVARLRTDAAKSAEKLLADGKPLPTRTPVKKKSSSAAAAKLRKPVAGKLAVKAAEERVEATEDCDDIVQATPGVKSAGKSLLDDFASPQPSPSGNETQQPAALYKVSGRN